jgi:hypothetical protein
MKSKLKEGNLGALKKLAKKYNMQLVENQITA